MATEAGFSTNDAVPIIWQDDYLGSDSKITFTQIVDAFVNGVPGMAAVDVANCLIHLMSFCRCGSPMELQRAVEFLNHANNHYYGINPNWDARPIKEIINE